MKTAVVLLTIIVCGSAFDLSKFWHKKRPTPSYSSSNENESGSAESPGICRDLICKPGAVTCKRVVTTTSNRQYIIEKNYCLGEDDEIINKLVKKTVNPDPSQVVVTMVHEPMIVSERDSSSSSSSEEYDDDSDVTKNF